MEIIIDILKVLLLCALVLGILQLLAKCCKFQLPKRLRWNKVRTWLTIILIVVNLLIPLSCDDNRFRLPIEPCNPGACHPVYYPIHSSPNYKCNYAILEMNVYTIFGKRDLWDERHECPYYPNSKACIEIGYTFN